MNAAPLMFFSACNGRRIQARAARSLRRLCLIRGGEAHVGGMGMVKSPALRHPAAAEALPVYQMNIAALCEATINASQAHALLSLQRVVGSLQLFPAARPAMMLTDASVLLGATKAAAR